MKKSAQKRSSTASLRLSKRRLFYNNDGSFLLYCTPPLSGEDFVYDAVGRLFGSQVDAIVCHMFSPGDAVPLYPTQVKGAEGIQTPKFDFVSEWRRQEICQQFQAQGIDPWQLALEATHSAGIEYWAGMRFNDLHGPGYAWPSKFRAEHPEYELGDHCGSGMHAPNSVYRERCTGLNFALPAVRAHRLALVKEVCTRYDVDGFEWDFLREPGHHFPNLEHGRVILTDYVREARRALHEIGRKRGRTMGFGIRVPGTLEKCHSIGLELETWIREGLLDYVSPAPHWDTATDLPFDAFVNLARNTNCRIYACTSEQVGPGHYLRPPTSTLRAGALNAWRQGVDGIYVFNFHHQIGLNLSADEEVLHELGNVHSLEFKDKQYVVTGCFECLKQFPHGSTVFQAFEHQLPVTLVEQSSGPGKTIRFLVGDDLNTALRRGLVEDVTLELTVVELTPKDVVEFKLNGRTLPANPQVALPDYKVGRANWNEYQGNYKLIYNVNEKGLIHQGVNVLEAVLRHRNPDLRLEFVLHDLTLKIRYRILPLRV